MTKRDIKILRNIPYFLALRRFYRGGGSVLFIFFMILDTKNNAVRDEHVAIQTYLVVLHVVEKERG